MAENRLNYGKTKITYNSCNSLLGLVASMLLWFAKDVFTKL